MNSSTPLKDAWEIRLNKLKPEILDYTANIDKLQIGCAVMTYDSDKCRSIVGLVVKINPKTVEIELPYGGWADADFIEIMKLKINKSNIRVLQPAKE